MPKPRFPEAPILLVDDDRAILQSYGLTLRYSGLAHSLACPDPRRAAGILATRAVSLVVLDLCMPHVSGEDLLARIVAAHPGVPVIVITGEGAVDTAVRCMRAGAVDYLVKPVDRERLVTAVRRALDGRREASPRAGADTKESPPTIVTRDPAMLALLASLPALGRSAEPVLVTGETGVGKEMLARAIHEAGRGQGPFVAVNAAGLDDALFADTLFGHARSAYTGADKARPGLVEKAGGGTLFLDEIGELSLASQVKLLRLIQEREYYPLGSDTVKRAEARLVAATNLSLADLLDPARFRLDLYYRLRTHHLHIPSLRERPSDLAPLLAHFGDRAARALGREAPALPPGLLPLLAGYAFPGNIRELEAMVRDAVTRCDGPALELAPFRAWMGESGATPVPVAPVAPLPVTSRLPVPTLKEAEERLIEEALRRADGNQAQAAAFLGISRQALNRRLISQGRRKGAG